MIDRSDSVTINRPIEEVFAYVTDSSNDPAWHTDILESRKTSEGPIGIGTTWHVRIKPFMGISPEQNMKVAAFEPNRKLVLQGDVLRGAAGSMEPRTTYEFQPVGGGTNVTRHIQHKVSGMMWLMQPFMRWIDAPRRNRRFVTNLKRVLEQGAPPS